MPSWDNAVPKERTYAKISASIGAHAGYFVGFTDTWTDKDRCYNCKGQSGNDCKKCGGAGYVEDEKVGLRYEMPDGSIEQEQVTFKISPPRTINGSAVRSSKLYDRLIEFADLGPNAGPGDLGRWAADNEDCRIPVTIIIKQPGNYPKITEVVRRQEAPAQNRPQTAQKRPQSASSPVMNEIAQRAAQNASKGPQTDDLWEGMDDEIPY